MKPFCYCFSSRKKYIDLLELIQMDDLAMQSYLGGVELLIFTSKQLPVDSQSEFFQLSWYDTFCFFFFGMVTCIIKGIAVQKEYTETLRKTYLWLLEELICKMYISLKSARLLHQSSSVNTYFWPILIWEIQRLGLKYGLLEECKTQWRIVWQRWEFPVPVWWYLTLVIHFLDLLVIMQCYFLLDALLFSLVAFQYMSSMLVDSVFFSFFFLYKILFTIHTEKKRNHSSKVWMRGLIEKKMNM